VVTLKTNLLRALALVLLAVAGPAFAQGAYPNKQVRIVVPFPAGGSADVLCRIIGEKLSAAWGGQPVIVDNRAGAGGNVGAEIVYRAEPDGSRCCAARPHRWRSTIISTRRCPMMGRSSCRSACWRWCPISSRHASTCRPAPSKI
jgi:hypothetical protein